jgi:hypothetical protein
LCGIRKASLIILQLARKCTRSFYLVLSHQLKEAAVIVRDQLAKRVGHHLDKYDSYEYRGGMPQEEKRGWVGYA